MQQASESGSELRAVSRGRVSAGKGSGGAGGQEAQEAHLVPRIGWREHLHLTAWPRSRRWHCNAAAASRGRSDAMTCKATGELRPARPGPSSRPGVSRPSRHSRLARLGVAGAAMSTAPDFCGPAARGGGG